MEPSNGRGVCDRPDGGQDADDDINGDIGDAGVVTGFDFLSWRGVEGGVVRFFWENSPADDRETDHGGGVSAVWLAVIILGRDVGLAISAIYFRWISLPPPKTMARYWDFSLPSAEVYPTTISKVRSCKLLFAALFYSALLCSTHC